MKARTVLSILTLLAAPILSRADQLIPAGSVLTCTVSEKVSSKTMHVGDPVMCTLGHTDLYGRFQMPYGAYLMGTFAEYKDPGHFVGKGWMELDFDRMIIQPDTVIPVHARVVQDNSKLPVDAEGKMHGTGHPVKDTVEWLIPVLWPIDLINLPRRGPTPTLKAESKLTLRVIDDFGIPTPQEDAVRKPALIARQTPDEVTYDSYRPQNAPIERQQPQYAPQQYAPQPQYQQPSSPVVVNLVQPAQQQQPIIVQAPQQQQPVYIQQQAPPVVVQQAPRYYYPPPPPPVYGPYRYYYRGY